jgi:hypothetical protein
MASERNSRRSSPVRSNTPALSLRLAAVLREAERDGYGQIAEALNAVIVALSDAKEKAQRGRDGVGKHELQARALFDEVSAL